MINRLRLPVFFYAVAISGLYAETAKEIAEKAHLAGINALLIFASQDGLMTGRYHFTDVGVDMELYKLPFTYRFESKKNSVDSFMVANIGYSRVFISDKIDLPPNSRLNYDNHTRNIM